VKEKRRTVRLAASKRERSCSNGACKEDRKHVKETLNA